MIKSKNFFYRIEPMAVLSEMICVPESQRGEWSVQFFRDLKNGIADEAKTSIAADIIKEADEYRARRALAGGKGGLAKASNAVAKASNATIPASIDVANCSQKQLTEAVTETKEKPLKTSSPDALRLADKLADLILNNNPSGAINLLNGKRDSTVKKWSDDIDKLNRLDSQSWEHIEKVILWCQQDSFWKSNILSGGTLRKQWPKLSSKAISVAPVLEEIKISNIKELFMLPENRRIELLPSLPIELREAYRLEFYRQKGM